MKKFLALAVLATSTVSFAASDIYDIQYLPAAGTSYGFTTGTLINSSLESDAGDEDIDGYFIEQTLGHAISDRLSLQVSLDYTNLESDPEGDSKYDYTKGFSDPTIAARFRTMDEAFRWDLIGGATISLGDEEVKSDNDTNNLQGGHSLFIGTQFGTKTESFQWAILGQLTHNLEATTEDDTVGTSVDKDANNELLIRGDILNKINEKSFLRSHLSVNFTEDFDDDQTPAQTTASRTTYEIGAEYQHLMSQDLLLRAGVDYSMLQTQTGQIDSWNTWAFTVGANYQF